MKPIYAVSTSVASGKTFAAVGYMARPEAATQDFIYVAPTIRLLDQTAEQLRSALRGLDVTRSVHLIHSEAVIEDGQSAAKEALLVINERPTGVGRVVLLTTSTFLKILPNVSDPERWSLILDEAFAPVRFIDYHLGPRPEEGLDYFREMFSVDPADSYRVAPLNGRVGLVEEVASGVLDDCGQRYLGQRELAEAVSNAALRCELVVNRAKKAPAPGDRDQAFELLELAQARALRFACYITPEYFCTFREAIILSALFEHTVLYHLWSRCFGVRFEVHPWFDSSMLRDVHQEQGPMISIGHLLHPTDRASKHNLLSNRATGKPGESAKGERVVDDLVRLGAEFLQGSTFLLQTNNGLGYGSGGAMVPVGGVPIPVASHGLNQYLDVDNIVALAVTNPNPQETEWVQARTGLSRDEVLRAYRIHTVYQAVGRTSIRSVSSKAKRKVFVVAGYEDALLLRQLFPGSHWLGQVGDQPALGTLRDAVGDPGQMRMLAQKIIDYLDDLPNDITALPSRAVKVSISAATPSRTWTEAARIAGQESLTWRKDGHRFRRIAYHEFFESETDQQEVAETGMNDH